MLKISYLESGWDLQSVFGDRQQWCPVCGSRDFVWSEPAGGLSCQICQAEFACRPTAGDPGLVVDCWPHGYDHQGAFKGRGVKFWLDPGRFHQQQISFWQVLKTCERGLEDRDHWCSSYKHEGHRFHIVEAVGVELYCFRAGDVARFLLYRSWCVRHPQPATDDPGFMHWQSAMSNWVSKRQDKRAEKISLGRQEGYYVATQCDTIFSEDNWWIHRCLPRPGEQPVVGVGR